MPNFELDTAQNGHAPTNGVKNGNGLAFKKDSPTNSHKGSPGNEADFIAFERVSESADYLMNRTKLRPKIAIICGSGLASLADLLHDPEVIDYSQIPNFPLSTVPGHKSRMIFGRLEGVEVMLMQGRFHAYEGYPMQLCGMPVRVMKLCGIQKLIVTNAAGGLHASYKVGDLMILKDHINLPGLAGQHPLKGPNDHRFGGRFFALNDSYDKSFRTYAKDVAKELNLQDRVHEGVYAMLGGPNFETMAELRMLRTCGVDAVGMSTIPEVLVASHCGLRVFSFSLITNECVTAEENENGNAPEHEEVIAAAKQKEAELRAFVSKMVLKIHANGDNAANGKQ